MNEVYLPLRYKTHFLAITVSHIILLIILGIMLLLFGGDWGFVFYPYYAAISFLFYLIFLPIIIKDAARQLIETKPLFVTPLSFLYGNIAPVIFILATFYIAGKFSLSLIFLTYCGAYASAIYLLYFYILQTIRRKQEENS